MAPKSLLRYIFRHGPDHKARVVATTPHSNTYAHITTSVLAKEPILPQKHAIPEDEPDSSLAYKSRSQSRQSSVLNDIEEERSSNKYSSACDAVDNISITKTLAALDLDIDTFTTRGLITASVDEARLGSYAHLETIHTILALLDTLDGFSVTIDVLRKEMEKKKCVCEEKLAMFEDVYGTIARLRLEDEEDGMSGVEEH